MTTAATTVPELPKKWAVVGSRDKDSPWYEAEIQNLSPTSRAVLENYAGIPPDEVENHVREIREKAWQVWPYPCIGGWRFLDLGIGQAPQYDEVLRRVKQGERYLDMGCCFGQDIRKLVSDGAPSTNIYATDLNGPFFDLGYDLFRDRASLKAQFFAADMFAYDPSSTTHPLSSLTNTIDIIHASSFFHLFSLPDQIHLGCMCVSLLKKQSGSLIFGRQTGNETAGIPTRQPAHVGRGQQQRDGGGESRENNGLHAASKEDTSIEKDNERMYRHNEASFRKMWEEIGEKTSTKWRVEYEDRPTENWGSAMVPGRLRMKFACFMV